MITSGKDLKRVMKILKRLIAANKDIYEVRNTKWVLTLIDDPQVNASAFPVLLIYLHT